MGQQKTMSESYQWESKSGLIDFFNSRPPIDRHKGVLKVEGAIDCLAQSQL